MGYMRDPLSVLYDDRAGALLGRAYARPQTWEPTTLAAKPAWESEAPDAGGLRPFERAFQRSLYYVHNGGANGRRNSVWSLQVQWGEMTGRGRLVAVRVSPVAVGRRAVNRKPDLAWYKHNELQSGGYGSTKQRFAS